MQHHAGWLVLQLSSALAFDFGDSRAEMAALHIVSATPPQGAPRSPTGGSLTGLIRIDVNNSHPDGYINLDVFDYVELDSPCQ